MQTEHLSFSAKEVLLRKCKCDFPYSFLICLFIILLLLLPWFLNVLPAALFNLLTSGLNV